MSRYIPVLQEMALPKPFELRALLDIDGLLELRLESEGGGKLRVRFDSYLAYRKLDEGDAMSILRDIQAGGVPGKSFYRVEESEFVAWFMAQCFSSRAHQPLTHFCILTVDDVIDILARDPPTTEKV
jgi:hypothetical protein